MPLFLSSLPNDEKIAAYEARDLVVGSRTVAWSVGFGTARSDVPPVSRKSGASDRQIDRFQEQSRSLIVPYSSQRSAPRRGEFRRPLHRRRLGMRYRMHLRSDHRRTNGTRLLPGSN